MVTPTYSMESSPITHHRRSTSSTTLPTHDNTNNITSTPLLETRKSVSQNSRRWSTNRNSDEARDHGRRSSPDLGLLLLSAAQSFHASGDDPIKAKRYALKAAEYLERKMVEQVADTTLAIPSSPTVELLTSLHLLAATLCKLGLFEEAIQVLNKSIKLTSSVPNLNPELANASFFVFMQLGDIYFMLGHYDSAMDSYRLGLDVQTQALGMADLQVAETCRYIAESYLQLMQFKEAEELCALALKIHQEGSIASSNSLEEVAARRVMGLIYSGMGKNRAALEQLLLASAALSSLPSPLSPLEVAFLDASIGDTYLALGKYDEAVSLYQKALSVFKKVYGEGHTSVASICLSLADLHLKRGMFKEAKLHCEKALVIYGNGDSSGFNSAEDIAIGLAGVAGLFESMGELKHAISLLEMAREILESSLEHPNVIVGGIEAQMGVLLQMNGNYQEAYLMLRSAISRYSLVGQKKSLVVGMLQNQMGLACVGLNAIWEAADRFEESRVVFEQVCGAGHSNTLDVCINLAGAYDAMGRVEQAISLLDKIIEEMENRLGTAHPEVEHIREWHSQMLKETGRSRTRKPHTLHDLLLLQKKGDAENVPRETGKE